jgi:hypothetical protein
MSERDNTWQGNSSGDISINIGNVTATYVAVSGRGNVTIGGVPATQEEAEETEGRLKKVMDTVQNLDLKDGDFKLAQRALDELGKQLHSKQVNPRRLAKSVHLLSKINRTIALALVPLMMDPIIQQVFQNGGSALWNFWQSFIRLHGSAA